MSQLQHNTIIIQSIKYIFTFIRWQYYWFIISSINKYQQLSMTKCSAIVTGMKSMTETTNVRLLDENQRIIMITKISDVYLIFIVPSVF